MTHLFLVWGRPDRAGERTVLSRHFPTATDAGLNEARTFGSVDVGGVNVSGPVMANHAATATLEETVVILAGQGIPEWSNRFDLIAEWEWQAEDSLPRLDRIPLRVEVLLLSTNWSGTLDGLSSTVWVDAALQPMQRLNLPIDLAGADTIAVNVLEVGSDGHGAATAVVYVADQADLNAAHLGDRGWRREPWARTRTRAWGELAKLSEALEARVSFLFRQPIVRDVIIHNASLLRAEAISLLPADVQDALTVALADEASAAS